MNTTATDPTMIPTKVETIDAICITSINVKKIVVAKNTGACTLSLMIAFVVSYADLTFFSCMPTAICSPHT